MVYPKFVKSKIVKKTLKGKGKVYNANMNYAIKVSQRDLRKIQN